MTLPRILTEGNEEEAARLLAAYYRRTADGRRAYTGSYFNSWAGGGDSGENRDSITADDLVAVSFLAVDTPGEAAVGILDTHRVQISGLLAKIPADRDLAEIPSGEFADTFGPDSPATQLWHLLRGRDTGRWGVGETKTSKIMARKRPRLVPIYDSVVGPLMSLIGNSIGQWSTWHNAFIADPGLSPRMREIRDKSEIEEPISDLRVMDIVLWMYGKQFPMSSARSQE